jgi:uncharacterized membrane protein (UPF0136 family)
VVSVFIRQSSSAHAQLLYLAYRGIKVDESQVVNCLAHMNNKTQRIGRWYIGFGVFLVLCGVAGYASNPAAAKSALMSGGTFGALSALWGFWMLKGGRLYAFIAASLTTLLLIAAFSWRSIVAWQAYADGQPKLFAAALISSMLVGSIISFIKLLAVRKALLTI